MRKRPSEVYLKGLVDQWNSTYPVGTAIDYTDDLGMVTESKTRSEAQVLGGHSAVVWIEAKPGCVSLARVRLRTEPVGTVDSRSAK